MLDKTQPSACGYIRLFLPLTKKAVTDELDIRFVTLEDLPYFTADVVITQRTAIDTREKAERLLAYCRIAGARFVYDLDDDLLSLPGNHPEHQRYSELKSVMLRLIAEADELWVSTPAMAERFIGIAKRITTIPNELDDRVWHTNSDEGLEPPGPVRFLYMGTSTHRPDFDQIIKPAWAKLIDKFGIKIQLDLIGVSDETNSSSQWNIVRSPSEIGNTYPAFATWLQSLRKYDVGLAPLLDNSFNRCKSDLKWLEYSAMGLATIAADLPAYSQSIGHERTGLLAAADAESFYGAMHRLVVDSDLRRSLKQNVRRIVEEKLLAWHTTEPRLGLLLELASRPKQFGYRSTPQFAMAASDILLGRIDREILSRAFLDGRGIEIGALQQPLPTALDVEVRYVDRMSKADLYRHYPELKTAKLVEVDIIDDGERLSTFQDSSQDFIIVNHFIEHCQDPIGTFENFIRVLCPGGHIYMAVPDMRFTFDRNRARTDINHIIRDHVSGPEESRKQHYREWVTLVEPHFNRDYGDEASIENRVRELMTQDYSIHFHTFFPEDMRALINYCAETERMPLSIIFNGEFGNEMIFILRKTDASHRLETAQENAGAVIEIAS
jgi:glycosyltransferase involved in cell wall biosynthesis/SAM-dependent methyltransferase